MLRYATLSEGLRAAVGDRVPGIAIAIVGPEGIREVASAGFADLAASVEASTEMVCPWFSMTKIVTATTAMRLAERHILDLDEPVLPLVPPLRTLQPATFASRITARHLLSHSAGLANPIPVRWIHPAEAPAPDPETFLDGLLAKNRRLRFEPGTRSSYSNVGTLVLGSALATASGKPFVELVREEALEPLRMAQTGFAYSPELEVRAATGYHPRWSPMRLLLPRWVVGPAAGRWVSFRRFLLDGAPYGGLVGPVDDAARFVQMHLRDGSVDGLRVLMPDSATAMRDIRVQGRRYDLGLGWFRPSNQRNADPPFVEHLGGGAGFFNVIRIYPTREVGIVVMGNATNYDIDAVAGLALRP
jgi:CubicO group peptidase (beta-lactamase class C family)